GVFILNAVFLFLLERSRTYILFAAFAFFVLGILLGLCGRTIAQNDIGNTQIQGQMTLEGKVVTLPEKIVKGKKETLSFVIQLFSIYHEQKVKRFKGNIQVFVHNGRKTLHLNDVIRIRGQLETPKSSTNFYSFDYAEYLSFYGIHKIFRAIGPYSILRQTPAKQM